MGRLEPSDPTANVGPRGGRLSPRGEQPIRRAADHRAPLADVCRRDHSPIRTGTSFARRRCLGSRVVLRHAGQPPDGG